jgi:hypothetical protein
MLLEPPDSLIVNRADRGPAAPANAGNGGPPRHTEPADRRAPGREERNAVRERLTGRVFDPERGSPKRQMIVFACWLLRLAEVDGTVVIWSEIMENRKTCASRATLDINCDCKEYV